MMLAMVCCDQGCLATGSSSYHVMPSFPYGNQAAYYDMTHVSRGRLNAIT